MDKAEDLLLLDVIEVIQFCIFCYLLSIMDFFFICINIHLLGQIFQI